MSVLTVSNVPDDVVEELRQRAVERGVSAEDEHRRILREALAHASSDAPSAVEHLLSHDGRVDELPIPHRHRSTHRDVVF